MNIQVMSREQAIQYCKQPHRNKTIIISIITPKEQYDDFLFSDEDFNGVTNILEVSFCDIDGNYPINTYKMKKTDAKKIIDFINQNQNRDIIVHCDYGVSRSAGIAAALSKYYNKTDEPFFNSNNYVPNMLCYRLILEELFGTII